MHVCTYTTCNMCVSVCMHVCVRACVCVFIWGGLYIHGSHTQTVRGTMCASTDCAPPNTAERAPLKPHTHTHTHTQHHHTHARVHAHIEANLHTRAHTCIGECSLQRHRSPHGNPKAHQLHKRRRHNAEQSQQALYMHGALQQKKLPRPLSRLRACQQSPGGWTDPGREWMREVAWRGS